VRSRCTPIGSDWAPTLRLGDDHARLPRRSGRLIRGFILDRPGWRLSPAYDINPSPQGGGLSLAIDETDNSLDFDLALSVAEYFRLVPTQARAALKSIVEAVQTWRVRAKELGISRSEQDRMAPAFARAENSSF